MPRGNHLLADLKNKIIEEEKSHKRIVSCIKQVVSKTIKGFDVDETEKPPEQWIVA